jgi:anthranilate synthase/aminodeoxychorismate synthase-like glutamine amidotransferase
MILLIDNYDSFVHNLARYFRRLGQETCVVRNDATSPAAVRQLRPEALVLSPGPCTPDQAGCSLSVVRELAGRIPLLGVCLGHQAIAAAFGGRVLRAGEPMHGRTSDVYHDESELFDGLPNPVTACRYHSLVVERATLPSCLVVTAHTQDGVVMAVRHREFPVVGLQFHPESVLTDGGFRLLGNFLRMAGLPVPPDVPTIDDEVRRTSAPPPALPPEPVTF